jgi:hypothetical protein
MSDEQPHLSVGRPSVEVAKVVTATLAAAVPGIGTMISAALIGGIQFDTTARVNECMNRLAEEIQDRALTVEALLSDAMFRQAVVGMLETARKQEGESKTERVHNFICNHLSAPTGDLITEEAVLRALTDLPASHIEALLNRIDPTLDTETLRESVAGFPVPRYSVAEIVKEEFAGRDDQDHCGSPASNRQAELTVLFESLENAGVFRRSFDRNGPMWFELTDLGRAFVRYCLPEPTRSAPGAAVL